MIFSKVTDLIGNTPVIQLPLTQADSRLYIKVEKNNPGGSMKDRMARNMIVAALKSGRIQPGGTIVESSSGNTGIGLALASIEFDLKFIAVVDHHAAQDKISIMRALGAEIRYVKGDYGENEVAVIERQRMAAEIASEISGAVFMNQSDNAANAGGYADLVREIVHQIVRVDAWVGCVGTGGSITGIAHGLKIHNPDTVTIAVEPEGSIVFGKPGKPYYQSGTGTPKGDTVGLVLDYSCIDYGEQVSDACAFETARYLARRFGLLVGGSTGGAIYKALELIGKGIIKGNVALVIADGGEKYLHTIFNEEWLKERDLTAPEIWDQLDNWFASSAILECKS